MNGQRNDRTGGARPLGPLLMKVVVGVALVLLAYGVWRNFGAMRPAPAPAAATAGAAATPRAVVETPVTRWASLDNLFIQRPVLSPGDELEIVAQWRFGADAGRWIHIECEIRSITEAEAPPLPCAMSAENRNILLLPLRTGTYQFGMKWSLDGHPSELRKLRFEVIDRGRGGALAGSLPASGAGPSGAATNRPAYSAGNAAGRATPGEGRVRTPEEQMDDLSRR